MSLSVRHNNWLQLYFLFKPIIGTISSPLATHWQGGMNWLQMRCIMSGSGYEGSGVVCDDRCFSLILGVEVASSAHQSRTKL
jgi:hypothetical protein